MHPVSTIDPVPDLGTTPMFRGMAALCLQTLTRRCSQKRVEKGQIIYRKGGIPRVCYCLLSGKVKLSLLSAEGEERITDVISAGQCFGDVELFSRQPYLAYAEALQACRFILISRESLLQAMEQEPRLAVRLLAQVAMRRVSMEHDMESWYFHTGDRRLMDYLLREESVEQRARGEATIHLGMRKNGIAARIGVTPETLSRIFREWADEGLITVLGSEITLHRSFFARAAANADDTPALASRPEPAFAAAV